MQKVVRNMYGTALDYLRTGMSTSTEAKATLYLLEEVSAARDTSLHTLLYESAVFLQDEGAVKMSKMIPDLLQRVGNSGGNSGRGRPKGSAGLYLESLPPQFHEFACGCLTHYQIH